MLVCLPASPLLWASHLEPDYMKKGTGTPWSPRVCAFTSYEGWINLYRSSPTQANHPNPGFHLTLGAMSTKVRWTFPYADCKRNPSWAPQMKTSNNPTSSIWCNEIWPSLRTPHIHAHRLWLHCCPPHLYPLWQPLQGEKGHSLDSYPNSQATRN